MYKTAFYVDEFLGFQWDFLAIFRYPVVLQRFGLRLNTGGGGKFRGGDGVVREMLFRKKLLLSVLTERRVFHPYGLQGTRTL